MDHAQTDPGVRKGTLTNQAFGITNKTKRIGKSSAGSRGGKKKEKGKTMTVGIPGTGIGGIYYLILALWMPVRELGLVMRGESSAARWRFIVTQLTLIAGMLLLMTLQGVLLKAASARVVKAFPESQVSQDLNTVVSSNSGLATSALWISLSMLGTIVLSVHAVRLALRWSEKSKPSPAMV